MDFFVCVFFGWLFFVVVWGLFGGFLVEYLFRLYFYSVIARVNRWSVTNSLPSTVFFPAYKKVLSRMKTCSAMFGWAMHVEIFP